MKFENITNRINTILVRRGYNLPEMEGFREFFKISHDARIRALAHFERILRSRLDGETYKEVMYEVDDIHIHFDIPCI